MKDQSIGHGDQEYMRTLTRNNLSADLNPFFIWREIFQAHDARKNSRKFFAGDTKNLGIFSQSLLHYHFLN